MSRMVILASQIADLGHLLAVSIFQFLRASAITVPQAAWLLLLVTKVRVCSTSRSTKTEILIEQRQAKDQNHDDLFYCHNGNIMNMH